MRFDPFMCPKAPSTSDPSTSLRTIAGTGHAGIGTCQTGPS
jgi:hypothetical protein